MTTEVRASHLLVKTVDEAKQCLEEIESGKPFEDVAAAVSLCPSGASGGDLGYFERGMMVKPFEDMAFDMEIGEISPPLMTQFGWHLIKLTDKK